MATGRWIRAVMEGEYTAGTFAGEIFQTGMSFVEGDAGGVFPSAIAESLPEFSASVIGEVTSPTNWDVEWAWEGDTKLTKANQVGIADACLAFWNALKGQMNTNQRWTGVRISAWDATRRSIGGANLFTAKTPVAGTASATSATPPVMCVVASLRTGRRGPAGRGRLYLPLNGTMASGGTVGSTMRTAANSATKDLAEDVRAIGPLAAVVNAQPLTYSALTQVSCGNLYDVQRRRDNAIAEAYDNVSVSL